MRKLVLSLILTLGPMALWGQISLKLDPARLKGGEGEVRFETNPYQFPAPTDSYGQTAAWHKIGNSPFRLSFDRTKIQHYDAQGFFSYEFLVQEDSTDRNQGNGFVVTVQATPVGDFADSITDVLVTVVDQGSSSQPVSDHIFLPIHNFRGKPFVTHSDELQEVYLGTTRNVDLEVQNTLLDMPVVIEPAIGVSTEQTFWKYTLIPDPGPLSQQSSKRIATVAIRPHFWSALSAALLPLNAKSEHDKLQFRYKYYADFGGQARDGFSTIKLRIAIPFWLLLIVASIGAVLGAVAGLILPSNPSRQTTKKAAICVAIVLSLIGESIGVLISLTNSKIVIFGLDLDARQLLPCFVLGAMIGLYGFRTADKYGAILGLKLPTP